MTTNLDNPPQKIFDAEKILANSAFLFRLGVDAEDKIDNRFYLEQTFLFKLGLKRSITVRESAMRKREESGRGNERGFGSSGNIQSAARIGRFVIAVSTRVIVIGELKAWIASVVFGK